MWWLANIVHIKCYTKKCCCFWQTISSFRLCNSNMFGNSCMLSHHRCWLLNCMLITRWMVSPFFSPEFFTSSLSILNELGSNEGGSVSGSGFLFAWQSFNLHLWMQRRTVTPPLAVWPCWYDVDYVDYIFKFQPHHLDDAAEMETHQTRQHIQLSTKCWRSHHVGLQSTEPWFWQIDVFNVQ